MPVLMRGKKIAVEKLGKASSKVDSVFHMPDDASAVGYIRYLGTDLKESDLKIGMKVYYGKNRHELKMDGIDVLIMEEDNIYAIVEEDSEKEKSKAST